MGFLRDIFDDVKNIVKDKVEKFVDKVDEAKYKAKEIVSDIIDIFTSETSSESSYSMEESDINTTERLNIMLKEFTEKYMKNAVEIENACIEAVEEYYERLVPIFERSQSIGYSRASIRRMKNNRLKIQNSIKDSIRQPLLKRMSLDDRECLSILEMKSGEKKKAAMKCFTQKVIKEALDNLADTVSEILNMQINDLEEGLQEIAEKREIEYANLKKYFDSFALFNNDEIENREKDCVLPLFIFSVADEVLQLIA